MADDLAPKGTVLVADEVWTAISEDGSVIESGEEVQVQSLHGAVLTVLRSEPVEDEES